MPSLDVHLDYARRNQAALTLLLPAVTDHPAWVETAGFLVQAERSGVKACLDQPWFTFLMTRQFICTPAQAADGQRYRLYTQHDVPRGTPVILRFSGIAVAAARS